jgi:hypothetical protein
MPPSFGRAVPIATREVVETSLGVGFVRKGPFRDRTAPGLLTKASPGGYSSGDLVDRRRRGDFRLTGRVNLQARRVRSGEERLCALRFFDRSARMTMKPSAFKSDSYCSTLSFGRYAQAVERGSESAQARTAFSRTAATTVPRYPSTTTCPTTGMVRNSPPKKSPPESAPKSAAGAPEFDAVAGVVEADDLLLGVIAFADDAEVFHVEPRRGQALHRLFRLVMGWIYRYRCLFDVFERRSGGRRPPRRGAYSSCEAFLEGFRPGKDACLLIEAYLPGMTGLELLPKLRADGHICLRT